MGKRSNFPKIDKDFYRTIDPRAIEPLIANISKIDCHAKTYAEPCSGSGDLVNMIYKDRPDIECWYDCDISWEIGGKDALTLTTEDIKGCDLIITNPPWSRNILHPLIIHLVSLYKPVWLLFDADWMHTKQSSEIMKNFCTHVVSVGRLKWIPDTNMSGKDNACWYRFSKHKCSETVFIGR